MSREEMLAALFAQMVIQQSNMAMMLLGKVPHPQTGQPMQDLEAARLFIDQLEMLEAKTRGNLSPQEQQLLKQSLTTLHMAFVDAVSSPEPETGATRAVPGAADNPQPSPETKAGPPTEEEGRKKFSKKY